MTHRDQSDQRTTRERILEATFEVLAHAGPRNLSQSDVARAAGVSRPTLYRWFPSKEALLEEFGLYEQQKYDAGIAAAVAGLAGPARLDAVLRYIVKFQHTYSLRRVVDVEPEHVVRQMVRVLPIMRGRLVAHIPGGDAFTRASLVTRIALSHALIPDDDPDLFLAELRQAAGIDAPTAPRRPRSTPSIKKKSRTPPTRARRCSDPSRRRSG